MPVQWMKVRASTSSILLKLRPIATSLEWSQINSKCIGPNRGLSAGQKVRPKKAEEDSKLEYL